MASPEAQLSSRLRELRRRHFGARGKPQFAARLGIPVEEYNRYERGALPGGELMVRICEVTGEDLQWLLTGREARQSLGISGARRRHRLNPIRRAATCGAQPRRDLIRHRAGSPVETGLSCVARS